MRPDTLTQKFVEDVIRDIRDRHLKGHDLFEGQVELGKKFGVSYTVVRKGLKRLIDQRLIYRIKGKGTYIAPREHFAINYMLVMVNPTKIRLLPDILHQLTTHLRSEFISRGQLMMTFMASEDLVDVRKMCYEDQIRGVFFLDINRSIPYMRDIEAFFKKRNIPIIYYEEKLNTENVNTISLDHKLAGALCANHLIQRGCRRIGMITDRNKGVLMTRVAGFLEEAKKISGVKADVIQVTSSPWIPEEVLKNYDGMAVLYEGLAYVAMAILQRYKVRYPADLALIGIDGTPVALHSKPALSTVTQPLQEMARIGVEKIYAMIQDPALRFEHIKVAPTLEPRKTS